MPERIQGLEWHRKNSKINYRATPQIHEYYRKTSRLDLTSYYEKEPGNGEIVSLNVLTVISLPKS